jgi:hypothetical protein
MRENFKKWIERNRGDKGTEATDQPGGVTATGEPIVPSEPSAYRNQMTGDLQRILDLLAGQVPGQAPYTGEDIYKLGLLPNEVEAQYKTLLNQGLYGPQGITTLVDMYRSGMAPTIGAYRRSAALDRQAAATPMKRALARQGITGARAGQALAESIYRPSYQDTARKAMEMEEQAGALKTGLTKENI